MRAAIFALVLVGAACGDDELIPPFDAAVVEPDAEPDAEPGALAHCLDAPGDLVRPPSGQLPCDLLPPGWSL